MVVTVSPEHVRLDQREIGQRSGGHVPLELGERHEVGRKPVLQPGCVDDAVNETGIGGATYTFQVLPCCSSRSKIVSASFCFLHLDIGPFTAIPDEVAAVQNDLFMNVCDGTSENQWSKTPNSRAMPLSTGTWSACTRS